MSTFDETRRAAREIASQKRRAEAKDFVRSKLLAHGRDLTRADLAVAVAYLDGLNWKDGYCYHGASALSRATGCCRRSVMSARKKLADRGFIVVRRDRAHGRELDTLKVTFPHLVQFLAPPSAEDCTTPSAEDCTTLVQGIAPKPLDLTPEDNPSPKASASRQENKGSPSEGDGFDLFWTTYPRKVAKAPARRAWARLSTAQRERAIAALPAFIAKLRRKGTEEDFIPYPATWLNAERFEEFEPAHDSPPADTAEYERNLARQFVLTEDWDRALGPRPGDPGSKVNAATLAEIRTSLRRPPPSESPNASGRVVPFEVPHAKARG